MLRIQLWTFDSILSGFTVAWLHVSPQDVCFLFITIIWRVCVLSSVISAWEAHLRTAHNTSETIQKCWVMSWISTAAPWYWVSIQSSLHYRMNQCTKTTEITDAWVFRGMCTWAAHQPVLQVIWPLDITLWSDQWFVIFSLHKSAPV